MAWSNRHRAFAYDWPGIDGTRPLKQASTGTISSCSVANPRPGPPHRKGLAMQQDYSAVSAARQPEKDETIAS